MKPKRLIRHIECDICHQTYAITGIATHLKHAHAMSVDRYVTQYTEYRPKYIDYKHRAAINNVNCKVCNQVYGSERLLSFHIRIDHCLTKKDYILKYELNGSMPVCQCGCKQPASMLMQPPYKRDYISGHNPNGMLGRTHNDASKVKMSTKAIQRVGLTTKVDTKPELEFESFLINNNIEYLKQFPTEYGSIDFYLVDDDMYVEIDGEYWHPMKLENLNFQLLGNAIHDSIKSKNLVNLYRVRSNDISNITCIDDIKKLNYAYDYSILYKQCIIQKEFLMKKDYGKYTWLLLKFIRHFQTEFPYPTTTESINEIIHTIPNKVDSILFDNTFSNVKASNIGVSYLKSTCKSYWHSKYLSNDTPVEIWNNNNKMTNIIKYRIGSNKNKETFNFSLHQLIRGISAIRGTISFFKPVMAAAIYKHFLGDTQTPTVIDPCAGFGGRLIGFKSMYPNGKYIGIEPNPDTYTELLEISKHFTNVELYNCKLEDYTGSKQSDLTFTSIPYYNTEIYSTHFEYNTLDNWKDTFIKSLLTYNNIIVNIPNELRNCFGEATEYFISNNTSHLNKSKSTKDEYVLVLGLDSK